jgi:hypothetical protein
MGANNGFLVLLFVGSSPDHLVRNSTCVAGAPSEGNVLGHHMVLNVGAARDRRFQLRLSRSFGSGPCRRDVSIYRNLLHVGSRWWVRLARGHVALCVGLYVPGSDDPFRTASSYLRRYRNDQSGASLFAWGFTFQVATIPLGLPAAIYAVIETINRVLTALPSILGVYGPVSRSD